MDIEKAKMMSLDMTQENIKKIGELFPNVVTEVMDDYGNFKLAINFEVLKQELSNSLIDEKQERYQITWPGKKDCIHTANTSTTKTLCPKKEESIDFSNTKNVYIKGDNIDAMKILRESYLGKVKMIYIDPPYNTGNDDLPYPDIFEMSEEEFKKIGGYYDEDGNRTIDNVMFRNESSGGKYHSNWLNILYPRLKLAKDFLSDDGVIFISIDDNEAFNLRRICDEIFGERNYIETFYIQVRYGEKSLNEKDDFQKLVEQVIIYAKNRSSFVPNKPYDGYDLSKFCWKIEELTAGTSLMLGGKNVTLFKPGEYIIKEVPFNLDALKETWASGSVLKGNTSGKFFDKQLSGRVDIDGYGCLYKVEGIGEDGIGYRYFTGPKKEGATKGKFYSGVPTVRREEIANGESRKYRPIINFYDYSSDFGNISHEGGVTFRGGKKPVKMLKSFIDIANLHDGDIVFDFFSGSASTGHAVFDYAAEKAVHINFVLVQIPVEFDEDSDYRRQGFNTICDLALTRLANVHKDMESDLLGQQSDTGFRVFDINTSNMNEVYYNPKAMTQNLLEATVDNIKPDRTALDLLFQVMLECGALLSSKIEEKEINGKKVFIVEDNYIVACFDDELDDKTIEAIAKLKPIYACFKGSSFDSDSANINAEQIFKTYSPNTEKVKVI